MNRSYFVRGLALLGLAFLSACGSREETATFSVDAQPSNTMNICAIYRERPHWRGYIEQASRKYGMPVEVMMAIIWRESRFHPTASPGTSSAYGYSQAINGTWQWYKDATGRHSARRDNFEDAADFVGWYMTRTVAANGLDPADSFAHYLAYHEGHGGYSRGTYWQKEFLLNAASEVQAMTQTYYYQLFTCSDRSA